MINIFVSSTFADMQEERDLLHDKIAPIMNNFVSKYGEKVSFCDLRWGVNTKNMTEIEQAQKVLDVCLGMIDRCKPYMIVVLGDRYGWIPSEHMTKNINYYQHLQEYSSVPLSITAMEIIYGALQKPYDLDRVLFYFRKVEGNVPKEYAELSTENQDYLALLKKTISQIYHVKEYTVSWSDEENRFVGEEKFTEMVEQDLVSLLDKEFQLYSNLSEYKQEETVQLQHTDELLKHSVFRQSVVEEIAAAVSDEKSGLIVLKGESGCGKTHLMAQLCHHLREKKMQVIPVFVGITKGSMSDEYLAKYLVEYLLEKLKISRAELEQEVWKYLERPSAEDAICLNYQVQYLVEKYNEKETDMLVFMVDGADCIMNQHSSQPFLFVPGYISEKVRYVISGCELESLENQADVYVIPPYEEIEKRSLIQSKLISLGRELPEEIIDCMLQKCKDEVPLYIDLLLSRLLLMRKEDFVFCKNIDEITENQMNILEQTPSGVPQAFCYLLEYILLKNPKYMVLFKYMALSCDGLTIEEMQFLMNFEGHQWDNITFMCIIGRLRNYLSESKNGKFNFSNELFVIGIVNFMARQNVDKFYYGLLECAKKYGEVANSVRYALELQNVEYIISAIYATQNDEKVMAEIADMFVATFVCSEYVYEHFVSEIQLHDDLYTNYDFICFLVKYVSQQFIYFPNEIYKKLQLLEIATSLGRQLCEQESSYSAMMLYADALHECGNAYSSLRDYESIVEANQLWIRERQQLHFIQNHTDSDEVQEKIFQVGMSLIKTYVSVKSSKAYTVAIVTSEQLYDLAKSKLNRDKSRGNYERYFDCVQKCGLIMHQYASMLEDHDERKKRIHTLISKMKEATPYLAEAKELYHDENWLMLMEVEFLSAYGNSLELEAGNTFMEPLEYYLKAKEVLERLEKQKRYHLAGTFVEEIKGSLFRNIATAYRSTDTVEGYMRAVEYYKQSCEFKEKTQSVKQDASNVDTLIDTYIDLYRSSLKVLDKCDKKELYTIALRIRELSKERLDACSVESKMYLRFMEEYGKSVFRIVEINYLDIGSKVFFFKELEGIYLHLYKSTFQKEYFQVLIDIYYMGALMIEKEAKSCFEKKELEDASRLLNLAIQFKKAEIHNTEGNGRACVDFLDLLREKAEWNLEVLDEYEIRNYRNLSNEIYELARQGEIPLSEEKALAYIEFIERYIKRM